MKTILDFVIVSLFAAMVLVGCGTVPGPTPTPTPDPTVVEVCKHLDELGCREGKMANCAAVFTRVMGDRLTDLNPSCLIAAATPAEARACRSVDCD